MDIVSSPTVMVYATKSLLGVEDLKHFLKRLDFKYHKKYLKCSCGCSVEVPIVITDKDFVLIGHYIATIEKFLDSHPEIEHEVVKDFIDEVSSSFKDFYREGI